MANGYTKAAIKAEREGEDPKCDDCGAKGGELIELPSGETVCPDCL
jgi:hypothetical protein